MKNLKFFSLFQTLSEKEVLKFQKHLRLTHAGEDVALKVFGYVKKIHPHFEDDKKLELDYAYRKIFKQPVSDKSRKNILNTFSDLYLWLKDFLLQEKVQQDYNARETLWLSILQERELNTEFAKSANRFYENHIDKPSDSLGKSIIQVTAAYFQHQYLSLPETAPDLYELDRCLQIMKEATDTIYARIFCERTQLNIRAIPPASAMNMPVPKAAPLRLVYEEIILMLQQDPITGEQHFSQALQLLEEHTKSIAPNEFYMLIKYLRNYASWQVLHKNTEKFTYLLHQINQLGLDNQSFTQKGIMSSSEFTSIVNAACSAKDFEWSDRFIATKADLLAHEIRHDTVILAQATSAFEQKRFKEVWQRLEHLSFKHTSDLIRAKLLFIRACYEVQPEHIDLLNECDRFDNWLYRNRKLKLPLLAATSGFMQILKLILQARLDKEVLLDRINNTKPLLLSHWLKEKLTDYEARYAPHKPGK